MGTPSCLPGPRPSCVCAVSGSGWEGTAGVWWPVPHTLWVSPLPQGAGQRVPVRGVWPGLPLPQGLAHEPCPQVLCVVSPAAHLHAPTSCTDGLSLAAGASMDPALVHSGCHPPPQPLRDPAPSHCPSLQEGPRTGVKLGSRRAWGRDAKVPRLGSWEPDPHPAWIVQAPPSLCSHC